MTCIPRVRLAMERHSAPDQTTIRVLLAEILRLVRRLAALGIFSAEVQHAHVAPLRLEIRAWARRGGFLQA
jgi:hypothetical protein